MIIEKSGFNLKATVNGINLFYDDLGEGNIPIIFLHGYPFDKSMWQAQLDFFKPSNRVIACDIRGFGKSKDEKSHLCIDLFTEDLIEFMNHLEIDIAILCGLSMGGYIALNAIKKFPERFEALILCDTQCIADTVDVKEKRKSTIEDILIHGATNFNKAFIKSVFHPSTLRHKIELVEDLSRIVNSNSQHIITIGLTALAGRTETCSILHKITVPTLIICGREDAVTPLVQSEFMNEHIKGSTLKIIENAGHVSNLEQPVEFNKNIHDFLMTL